MGARAAPKSDSAQFIVVGAGLTGSMIAALLGRAGHRVLVLERRGDPRSGPVDAGRSINLAISARGLNALARLGLDDDIEALGVPLYGRRIHSVTGHLAFQPYGDGKQAIYSFSRAELNLALVRAAGSSPNVSFRFFRRTIDTDPTRGTVTHVDAQTGQDPETIEGIVIAADGAYSVLRSVLQRREHHQYSQAYLEHGYKELFIPAGPDGTPVLERNALHIWPRGGFMMMAMANQDGSFTVTLYLPMSGPNSFASLTTSEAVLRFFEREFPDAVAIMPTLTHDFAANPAGAMVTVKTFPWHQDGRAVLLGDAAHAIVPFYGQGANAGFEDCLELLREIEASPNDLATAFGRYEAARKPNTDAIADLAITNFEEMRDHVASPWFLWKKRFEKLLGQLFPQSFQPLYPMISFSLIPYAEARARAEWQHRTLQWIGRALVAIVAIALVAIIARSIP
jgi:kynurenine 3-monooxygenase